MIAARGTLPRSAGGKDEACSSAGGLRFANCSFYHRGRGRKPQRLGRPRARQHRLSEKRPESNVVSQVSSNPFLTEGLGSVEHLDLDLERSGVDRSKSARVSRGYPRWRYALTLYSQWKVSERFFTLPDRGLRRSCSKTAPGVLSWEGADGGRSAIYRQRHRRSGGCGSDRAD